MTRSKDIDAPPPGSDPQRPSPELLLWAYRHGAFPMGDPDTGRIEWYCPDPRGIIPLYPPGSAGSPGSPGSPMAFHIPRNLAREVRKRKFEIRSDTAFGQVMRECGTDRDELNRSWINDAIIAAYCELHRMGHAHSVEAWLDGELVGGLYGVHIGGAFFGESMFSLPRKGGSNSSKVCLVHLVNWLRGRGFALLDTQFSNEHLDQFGCMEIPADEYLMLLEDAVQEDVTWGRFEPC